MTCTAFTVTTCCNAGQAIEQKDKRPRYVLTCTKLSIVTHRYFKVFDKTSRGTWNTTIVEKRFAVVLPKLAELYAHDASVNNMCIGKDMQDFGASMATSGLAKLEAPAQA